MLSPCSLAVKALIDSLDAMIAEGNIQITIGFSVWYLGISCPFSPSLITTLESYSEALSIAN